MESLLTVKAQLAKGYLQVYRYYCAWYGDPLQARAQTEYTLLQAMSRWRQAPPQEHSFQTWLLGLARYLRAFNSRKIRPGSDRKSFDTTDARMLLTMARLSNLLQRLPVRIAETLALSEIAGVSITACSAILGKTEKAILQTGHHGLEQLLAMWQDYPSELAILGSPSTPEELAASLKAIAENLHPESSWAAALEGTIKTFTARDPGLADRLVFRLPLSQLFHLRLITSWLVRIAPLLAILIVVSFIAWPYALPGPVIPTINPPTPAATVAYVKSSGSQAGYLVPPAAETCQAWLSRLKNDFSLPATLNMAVAYSNPVLPSEDPSGKGLGCQIEVVGDHTLFPQIEGAYQAIIALLKNQDNQPTGFRCDTCRANNYMFGEYWLGEGLAFQDKGLYTILSLAWRPLDPDACTSGLECQLPLDAREYALRLKLASGSAQNSFNTFFDAWIRGDLTALDALAPSLSERVLTIADLDHLAGFNRTPAEILTVTWQVVENSGNRIRMTIQASRLEKPILPSSSIAPFQIEWVQSAGRWLVSNLGPGILFPFSSDSVYWAGSDGTLYRYSLANQTTQALTKAGMYSPGVDNTAPSNAIFPQISPDGRWLVLDLGSGGQNPATTLLIDQSQPGQVVRLPRLVTLAWSSDSRQLAYVTLNDPHAIQLLSAPFGAPGQKLAIFQDILAALAWSPGGKQIAAVTTLPVETLAQDVNNIMKRDLSIVDVNSGEAHSLGSLGIDVIVYLSPHDLAWAHQGQEIWYLPGHIAIDVATGSKFPLVTGLDAGIPTSDYPSPSLISDWFLGIFGPYNMDHFALRSPDQQRLAYKPNDSTGNMIIVQSADDPPRNLWSNAVGNVSSLSWTQDSGSLIAGPTPGQPGRILRLLASTGEGQVVVENVYWIGVGSDMISNSQAQMVDAVQMPITAADQDSYWPCQTMGGMLECIQLPPNWPATQLQSGDVSLLKLTNFQIQDPMGWTSLRMKDRFVTFIFIPNIDDDLYQFFTYQFEVFYEKNHWKKITVNGVDGIEPMISGNDATSPFVILFHHCNSLLYINLLPFEAHADPDLQRILSSIRFQPCP